MASPKRLCDEKKDRISDLPRNLMDYIIERMPIHDAARTSILSRKWRYIWNSCTKLAFDEDFFEEISINHDEFIQYEFPKAINKTLLVHIGPVLQFFLQIPHLPEYDLSSEVDQWMIFLSRNGIRDLEVRNSNPTPYIMPSCIFLCSSLIDLKINNCMMKPSHAFGGLRYLVKLKLVKVSFSAGMFATLLRNSPELQILIMVRCTGIEHQIIHAPKLIRFCAVKSSKIVWQWFVRNKELLTVHIELGIEVKNVERNINMMKFLETIPKVKTLWLDGFSLKYLAGNPSQRFTTKPVQFLTWVRLRHFGVDDLDQISSVFFLLKSCSKLTTFEIDFATSTGNVTEQVKGYLESFNWMNWRLDRLQTVKITCFKGYKPELLFVKLLLSHFTCLKRMFIEQSTTVGASDGFKISIELLRFYRASTGAEIIYFVPNN